MNGFCYILEGHLLLKLSDRDVIKISQIFLRDFLMRLRAINTQISMIQRKLCRGTLKNCFKKMSTNKEKSSKDSGVIFKLSVYGKS
jgi:hypothetical protein